MEAPWPHGGLWGLALLPPALLLAALCARCRRPRGHGAQVDNYDYKPPPPAPHSRFMVITPPRCPSQPPVNPQPPQWGPTAESSLQLPSPQPSQSRRVSVAHPDPAPRDPPAPPDGDDDYSNEPYATGYVMVLPDQAPKDGAPPGRESRSSAAPGEEYENVPEGARGSLGDSLEYINVPPGGSSPCDASESEDYGPDYENV